MFLDFEHQLLRILRSNLVQDTGCLVAFSGGLDSSVLLASMNAISGVLNLKIMAAYVHHGVTSNHELSQYRKKAQEFTQKQTELMQIDYVSLGPSEQELKNESAMRDFRYQKLGTLLQPPYQWLLTAHHVDDLLETRLQRLIRGTGPAGLEGMRVSAAPLLRPLLSFTRDELETYAKQKNIQWLDDPSNLTEQPLRNWIRSRWLKDLEEKQAGAKRALARSLDLLLQQQVDESWPEGLFFEQGLRRTEFERLSEKGQRRAIAEYLSRLQVKEFSHSQIIEIVKQLDIPKKEHTFNSAQCRWLANAQQIVAFRQP